MLVLMLLAQAFIQVASPVGKPEPPKYVVIYATWDECRYSMTPASMSVSPNPCVPRWVLSADVFKTLAEVQGSLGSSDWSENLSMFEAGFREFVEARELETGKKLDVRFESREREEPVKVEARKWTERRVVVK